MDATSRRRLSRALSIIENHAEGWRETLAEHHRNASEALVIGVTGPPGAGKSSLVDTMAATWAGAGHRVGVLAIDPASPFSGGAVLGDRVRMRRSEELDAVFIRSMSTRGHAGGLNASAADLCAVLAGSGFSRIILETVGVGQNEMEVAFVADCTLVVAVPGLGDSVQAAKAGLMEVGDIYVVNKIDLPGAATVARDIAAMLSLVFAGQPGRNTGAVDTPIPAFVPGEARSRLAERFGDPASPAGWWYPPVVSTSADDGQAVARLVETIETCGAWLAGSGQLGKRRMQQAEARLRDILKARLLARQLRDASLAGAPFDAWVEAVAQRRLDAHEAADRLLAFRHHPTEKLA